MQKRLIALVVAVGAISMFFLTAHPTPKYLREAGIKASWISKEKHFAFSCKEPKLQEALRKEGFNLDGNVTYADEKGAKFCTNKWGKGATTIEEGKVGDDCFFEIR